MDVHRGPDRPGAPHHPADKEGEYEVMSGDDKPVEQAEDEGGNNDGRDDAELLLEPVLHAPSTPEFLDQGCQHRAGKKNGKGAQWMREIRLRKELRLVRQMRKQPPFGELLMYDQARKGYHDLRECSKGQPPDVLPPRPQ